MKTKRAVSDYTLLLLILLSCNESCMKLDQYREGDKSTDGGESATAQAGSSAAGRGGATHSSSASSSPEAGRGGAASPQQTSAGGAAAAGGAASNSSTPAPVVDAFSKAVQAYAEATCQKGWECSPGLITFGLGSLDECIKRTFEANVWEGKLPDSTRSSEFFNQCARAWSELSCTAFPANPPACVSAGLRENGEPCNAAAQCKSSFCDQTGWNCGTCAAPPVEGAPCAETWDCPDDLACFQGECLRLGGPNDTCSITRPCRGDCSCSAGRCVKVMEEVGADCGSTNGLGCAAAKNLTCNTTTNKCVSIEWGAAGDLCGSVVAGRARMCANRAPCYGNTCSTPPVDGGACDTAAGLNCEWPSRCVNYVCQRFDLARQCCPSGTDSCDGACVNLDTDPTNCGECGYKCDTWESCIDGFCELTRGTLCEKTGQAICARFAACNNPAGNASCYNSWLGACCSSTQCAEASNTSTSELQDCVDDYSTFDCEGIKTAVPASCIGLSK